MKLPEDAVIATEKITDYLLQWKPENDKSKFLSLAGYGLNNYESLAADLRTQILPLEASFVRRTNYGDSYEIRGTLSGPNGKQIDVVTIWMIESPSGQTKFITLFPDKE